MIVNVVFAGLGGQGVITASDILAEAAFRSGHDVKKAEVHGMSQRGGSVASEVRYGDAVLSPMVPAGEADCLVVLAADQIDNNRQRLKPGGVLLTLADLPADLAEAKCANVALLGRLSRHLALAEAVWHDAIRACLAEKLHAMNLEAFDRCRSG